MCLVRQIEIAVVLAAVAIAPLALSMVSTPHRVDRHVVRAFPLAGVALGIAFLFRGTTVASVLASLYVAACVGIASMGVRRFVRRRPFRLEETAIDLGLVYLAVGAAWALRTSPISISQASVA